MESVGTQSLWAVTPDKIREAVLRLVAAAHPIKIIMFGSRARGKTGRDSDLDLMVVTGPMAETERLREMSRLRDLPSPLRLPVDLLVVPASKLEYWRDTPGNVYYEAAMDGKVIYEQGPEQSVFVEFFMAR